MNPFDIINDISYAKRYILEDDKDYIPYIVNNHFSYFGDSIFFANQMNMKSNLDKRLQHDYYFHSLRKSKRKTKWAKKEKSDILECVQKYYNYGPDQAKEAIRLLTKKQIDYIVDKVTPKD